MTAPSNEEKKRKDAQAALALREAVREAIREELAPFREAVRQVIREELDSQPSITQQGQQSDRPALSVELGAIDAQIETMRLELQCIRTVTDLLLKASQAHALVDAAQIGRIAPQNLAVASTTRRPMQQDYHQQEEAMDATDDLEEDGEDCEASVLPLPKDIKLPGRGAGPTPIVLETLRKGGRS